MDSLFKSFTQIQYLKK